MVTLLPYVVIDRSTVHLSGWSWMVATLELELSRDTVPYNSVALPRLSPGDGDAAAESRNWPPLRWVPPDPA